MKRTTIIESIIFLYCLLFLYTGISKIIDYPNFKESLSSSPILAPISNIVATGLPLLEFLITIMLIIPRWRLKGLYSSLILMTLFTIYVIAILLFDDTLPCSCGGIIQQLSWPQHIIFNTIFILLAIYGIILQRKQSISYHSAWKTENPQTPLT